MCLISTSDVENDYGSVVVQEAEDLGDAALISKKNVLVPLAIHAMFCHFLDRKENRFVRNLDTPKQNHRHRSAL